MDDFSRQPVELAYDLSLSVRYGETGADGITTLSSVANWLQEAAGHSASSLGFGEETLAGMGLTWILTRLVLRIRRLPVSGEAIRVHTWPSALDRFGCRGYEVFDSSNECILSGGSAWSIMDMATRRMAPIPPQLAAVYPSNPRACDPFSCRVLPRLAGNGDRQALLRVRRDDLDINGHVNNAHYLSWLLESFEPRPGQALAPSLVDLGFRAECFPGEELMSQVGAEDGDILDIFGQTAPVRLVHAIRRTTADGTSEDVCRAVTLWRHSPLI
ncbi:MAG: acyl-ACP thioesterase [Desulfovibrionaceae bacterium]|nr:acyl-ACP thioesterase [Desulfovibrionaceae bacterium]